MTSLRGRFCKFRKTAKVDSQSNSFPRSHISSLSDHFEGSKWSVRGVKMMTFEGQNDDWGMAFPSGATDLTLTTC